MKNMIKSALFVDAVDSVCCCIITLPFEILNLHLRYWGRPKSDGCKQMPRTNAQLSSTDQLHLVTDNIRLPGTDRMTAGDLVQGLLIFYILLPNWTWWDVLAWMRNWLARVMQTEVCIISIHNLDASIFPCKQDSCCWEIFSIDQPPVV